jgi:hypothetical protein
MEPQPDPEMNPMHRRQLLRGSALAALALLAAPLLAGAQPVRKDAAADGWRPLFGGSTLAGWRGYKQDAPPEGWTVTDGVLSKTASVRDLITRDQFADFELEWEWKIEQGGNAGVFYRVTEEYDHPYWSAVEYQLLDDANAPDGKSRLTSAGAFAVYPSPAGVVKPAGQWNSSRVVAHGTHVEHWLNGQKMGEYDTESADFKGRVEQSKFKPYPNYAKARRGYIGIQGDHRGELTIRNMRIREHR